MVGVATAPSTASFQCRYRAGLVRKSTWLVIGRPSRAVCYGVTANALRMRAVASMLRSIWLGAVQPLPFGSRTGEPLRVPVGEQPGGRGARPSRGEQLARQR